MEEYDTGRLQKRKREYSHTCMVSFRGLAPGAASGSAGPGPFISQDRYQSFAPALHATAALMAGHQKRNCYRAQPAGGRFAAAAVAGVPPAAVAEHSLRELRVAFANIDWKNEKHGRRFVHHAGKMSKTVLSIVCRASPAAICFCEVGTASEPLSPENRKELCDIISREWKQHEPAATEHGVAFLFQDNLPYLTAYRPDHAADGHPRPVLCGRPPTHSAALSRHADMCKRRGGQHHQRACAVRYF